jgi:hypothetical protein
LEQLLRALAALFVIAIFVTGCKSADSALVGKWVSLHKTGDLNAAQTTRIFYGDGSYETYNDEDVSKGLQPERGTWKTENEILITVTGSVKATLAWQREGDQLVLTYLTTGERDLSKMPIEKRMYRYERLSESTRLSDVR